MIWPEWVAPACVMLIMAALVVAGVIHGLKVSRCSCKQRTDDNSQYTLLDNEDPEDVTEQTRRSNSSRDGDDVDMLPV